MSDWISIEDKKPEKGEYYLVYRKENNFPTTRFYNSSGNWLTRATVTHWMPLPSPPE